MTIRWAVSGPTNQEKKLAYVSHVTTPCGSFHLRRKSAPPQDLTHSQAGSLDLRLLSLLRSVNVKSVAFFHVKIEESVKTYCLKINYTANLSILRNKTGDHLI